MTHRDYFSPYVLKDHERTLLWGFLAGNLFILGVGALLWAGWL